MQTSKFYDLSGSCKETVVKLQQSILQRTAMSKKNKIRKQLLSQYGHKYKRHFISDGYKCFYCSEHAHGLDHVPPLSWMDNYDDKAREKEGIPAVLVPCCTECNSALLDRLLPTVWDRLLYLESYYDAYFKKQKNLWEEEEIEELGHSLKSMVRHKQERLNIYLDKIRAIQKRLIMTDTHPKYTKEEEE